MLICEERLEWYLNEFYQIAQTVGTTNRPEKEEVRESKKSRNSREESNCKLGIIVPYRDREQQLKRFLSHMKEYIKDIDYEIFIIEQQMINLLTEVNFEFWI